MEFYLKYILIQTESLLLVCNTPTEGFHHHHMKEKISAEKRIFHKGRAVLIC